MYRSTTRWTTAAAVAALIALPVAGAAQTTGTTPPQQPPAQTQPPAQPATTTEAQPGQVDATAAKKHLSEARDTLSQITSMPEAAKLQGDNRTQVSQLISNFNELITTQANWREAYAKVDANLTSLVGPEGSEPSPTAVGTSGTTGTPGATGTTGAATTALEPAIRTKLVEFRSHLKLFEKSAGGVQPESGATPTPTATATTAAPAASTPDPATTSQPPSSPSQPPSSAGATGTSGVTPSPTGTMAPMDQAKAADQVARAEADKHLDAIDAIISKSKNGSLTKDETTELKKHVELLRALLKR